MNWRAIRAIYLFEMHRTWRTLMQSVLAPVLSTSLYFVVFGGAIGSRMKDVDGVPYGAFIVPGLIIMQTLTQSVSNASFGIYFPKFVGTIYEVLSAPISFIEVVLGYVGAAATKAILLGLIILVTASLFVPVRIDHPLFMLLFLVATATTFALFGFVIGIWAGNFEQLQMVPLLILTPLSFLGGSFYSLTMLPQPWRTITLFNPVVYLISAFRWSFYSLADVQIGVSLMAILIFMAICLSAAGWMFKTGYKLKT
ncbi:MAG TPA: ABC transporter permease [Caulobacteraceae bacterium]|nr:ABC transporter permease [Caulobacteraceae bacterium]